MHEWFKASDSTDCIIKIFFIDLCEASDLTGLNTLMKKFTSSMLPYWSINFLSQHEQYVKVESSSASFGVLCTHAGTPQETLTGPNDCKLLLSG